MKLRRFGCRSATVEECRLELHPEKTKIVYCKDEDRRGNYPNEKFDFLGYTFRPRKSKNRWGKLFVNFSPAISDSAAKPSVTRFEVGELQSRSDKSIEDLSRMFNPILRGWLQYYGRYYRSAVYRPMRQLDKALARWASQKYKRLRRRQRQCTPMDRPDLSARSGVVCALADECGVVRLWEPYERRRSRTVLGEPRGAIPRGYYRDLRFDKTLRRLSGGSGSLVSSPVARGH